MFIIRSIRELLAIPFLWAGRLAMMLKLTADVPLLKAAWHISRNGRMGLLALSAIHARQGVQAAAVCAQAWMKSCPHSQLAAFAGLLAIDADNVELAKICLQQGRQLPAESDGLLEMLEFFIVSRSKEPGAMAEFTQRMCNRSDLPAHLTKLLRIELLWTDMLQGRLDSAADRAKHLLAIADTPEAEAALWALALHRNDQRSAQNHLMRVKLPTVRRACFLCLGSAAVGDREQAQLFMNDVRQADPAIAARLEENLRANEVTI